MIDRKQKYTNRLINEKSPYLLQHAHDPVDWYTWTEEAFEKAKTEDKLIFLSIGYSTCHWCHVIEKESFSDPYIARIMNTHYIAILVDREERPDLDNLYMKAVIAISGSGGWPLNLFLTPDKKPFYGGTYFPPEDKWGSPGLKTILATFPELWKKEREEVFKTAGIVTDELVRQNRYKGGVNPDKAILSSAYQRLSSRFDQESGGFGSGAKFPMPHALSFLLRYWHNTFENQPIKMVEQTLMHMAQGGIKDHIGGGFFRYSVDAKWLIPHFEKMLYDQALISKIYLEAYQSTHKKTYADIAQEIFDYVLRDLSNQDGGFYTGEDADSALDPKDPEIKKEGVFYLFSRDEIIEALGMEMGEIVSYYYGLDQDKITILHPDDKNLHDKHILYLAHSLQDTLEHFRKTETELDQILKESKEKLFQLRIQRPRPHRDNKILVDWNGLMISGLSLGAHILDEPKYLEEAEKAAQFILKNLVDERGRLLHSYCDGEAVILGMLNDYAFFIQALIDLYEATFNIEYLKEAHKFTKIMIDLFRDEKEGGFFFTLKRDEDLPVHQKEIYDGSIPSGNGVAALNLIRLARLLADRELEDKVASLFRAFSGSISQMPDAYCQLLIALDFALGPSQEIIFAGNRSDEELKLMIQECYRQFIPRKVVALRPSSGKELSEILTLMPFLADQPPLEGRPTAYVCENYSCKQPSRGLDEFKLLLKSIIKKQ